MSGSIGAHIGREGKKIGRGIAVGRRQLQVILKGKFRDR